MNYANTKSQFFHPDFWALCVRDLFVSAWLTLLVINLIAQEELEEWNVM